MSAKSTKRILAPLPRLIVDFEYDHDCENSSSFVVEASFDLRGMQNDTVMNWKITERFDLLTDLVAFAINVPGDTSEEWWLLVSRILGSTIDFVLNYDTRIKQYDEAHTKKLVEAALFVIDNVQTIQAELPDYYVGDFRRKMRQILEHSAREKNTEHALVVKIVAHAKEALKCLGC